MRRMLALVALVLAAAAESPAGIVVASYSGSYTAMSADPVADGIVSLRLSVGPMFADCDTGSVCSPLALLQGLNWTVAGTSFGLDPGAITGALGNGKTDVFSLAMNFGATYSPAMSGGGLAFFESILAGEYAVPDIDTVTFTIDQLLFRPVSTPFGHGTEATLGFTLSLETLAPGGGEFPAVGEDSAGIESAPLVSAEVPEPSTWLMVTMGILLIFRARRSSARLWFCWKIGAKSDYFRQSTP